VKLARAVALAALLAGVVAVGYVLFGGGDGHTYRLLFQTGGQLVKGNQALVAGQPIGIVDDISLTDDGRAQVEITVDEPLHEGTTAVIRSTSLSGIANRYVSVAPGPNSSPQLPDRATISSGDTTTPVDLDQLFAALDQDTRESLQKVIQGSAVWYTGNSEEARASYKYFGPALQSGERLLAELTRDERTLTEFLVSGADVLGTIAERRDDLSALTQNANEALGAIASENEALDRVLAALPPFMRQGNTTFVNLRAALDDLDPLVETSKRATRDLPQFLRDLRPVARRAVPVVGDLRRAVATPGPANDLTDVLRLAPQVERSGSRAASSAIEAMDATEDEIQFARPYAPELAAFASKLGQLTGYYDAHGHYARVLPIATGAFDYDSLTDQLVPNFANPADQFDFFTTYAGPGDAFDPSGFQRCPGGATQNAPDGSSPFLDDGNLAGQCDPLAVPIPGATP